uniref:intermembrane lipid transfer protein VPS13A-like n=1 Tax=Myxine glutinosa TaxID=7769 RepID=UPI00358EE903
MVFESFVVNLLNRFLSDYVENLDTSQLSIGIWGGDAVLENLKIKENALSALDVPFKIKAGYIGKLSLNIPWKNLYKEAVVATLEGVYLLVVPTASIVYDAEKEEKQTQEAKQIELQKIEEALQKAEERDTPQVEQVGTFAEKLTTQVIKNLQVTIASIHARYEDDITNPTKPLSVGLTLESLTLKTSDHNWKPCLLDDTAKLFYKLVCLNCLAVYWNVGSTMLYRNTPERILELLKSMVASSTFQPKEVTYVFRPISASAKLRMNPKAYLDLAMPKINLDVILEDIDTQLTRPQYLSIMEVLESYDRMTRNLPYRKYRPTVSVKEHACEWWIYVVTGVLEVTVRRKMRMWSWKHIRRHRMKLKRYCILYKEKITQKTPPVSLNKDVEDMERDLDVLNITLARRKAEAEALSSGFKIYGKGKASEEPEKKSGGWLSGWWGSKEEEPERQESSSMTEGLSTLMSPEEKAKLYAAIDYSETSTDTTVPENYVEKILLFSLKGISCTICTQNGDLLHTGLKGVQVDIQQRPSAQAMRVGAKLERFWVSGLAGDGGVPVLLAPRGGKDVTSDLLELMFETNPLDKKADQRLNIQSRPLEITYNAATINGLAEFFQPPENIHLDQIATATKSKLEEFRERTATGLTYVIETHKVLDLSVDLQASYVIVPHGGSLHAAQSLLILDMGTFKVTSVIPPSSDAITVKMSLEEIMKRAYENFIVKLNRMQILFVKAGEDWLAATKMENSKHHVLQPMTLELQLASALVTTDARMPKFKLSGALHALRVSISDEKVKGILGLVESIPLPKSAAPARTPSKKRDKKAPQTPVLNPSKRGSIAPPPRDLDWSSRVSSIERFTSDSDSEYLSADEDFYDAHSNWGGSLESLRSLPPGTIQPSLARSVSNKEPPKNMTDLKLLFEIKEIFIELCTHEDGREEPVVQLEVQHLGTELTVMTYNLYALSYIKEIQLSCLRFTDKENNPVHIMSTLENEQDDLFTVTYIKADKNGPEFHTAFRRTEQKVEVTFTSLDLLLHTDALLFCLNFLQNLLPQKQDDGASPGSPESPIEELNTETVTTQQKVSRKDQHEDLTHFQLIATLEVFDVCITTSKQKISNITIEGLNVDLSQMQSQMSIAASLQNITVLDADLETEHKRIISIIGQEVFRFSMISYTDSTEGDSYSNMDKVDSKITLHVGCIRAVYLNKFVSTLLDVVSRFQTAKEAVAEATAQAAEKAASNLKDLAQRSFRLLLDVTMKAPVVIVPRSSVSHQALLGDLGLVRVTNEFRVVPGSGFPTPPIMDIMTVRLSQLKLSRVELEQGKVAIEDGMVEPLNLEVSVRRNLAAAWFHGIPDIEINGKLKPMVVTLRQDDVRLVMATLSENLTEGPTTGDIQKGTGMKEEEKPLDIGKDKSQGDKIVISAVVESKQPAVPHTTLKFDFNFDALSLLLLTLDPSKKDKGRSGCSKLGEFQLKLIRAKGGMTSDGWTRVTLHLSNCMLDDLRPGDNIMSRMIEMRAGEQRQEILELSYAQSREEMRVDCILRDLFICASVEFLMAVTDFFTGSLAAQEQAAGVTSHHGTPKPTKTTKEEPTAAISAVAPDTNKDSGGGRMVVSARVTNPEVLFVADLRRSDSPSLLATLQLDFDLKRDGDKQTMTAAVRDLQVVACPLVRSDRKGRRTTVLQPTCLFLNSKPEGINSTKMDLHVKDVVLKVSPVIINSVTSILAALSRSATESEVPQDEETRLSLWDVSSWENANFWFLQKGVDGILEETINGGENEVEEEEQEDDGEIVAGGQGNELMELIVESLTVTLEAGVGHRTVPLLLTEAKFSSTVWNWSSLLHADGKLTLEILYYNELLAVWEPLLEPMFLNENDLWQGKKNEHSRIVHEDLEQKCWELALKVRNSAVCPARQRRSSEEIPNLPPVMAITVTSQDMLNITLSQQSLTMISNLGKAFAEAASLSSSNAGSSEEVAPVTIKNCLGLPLDVRLGDAVSPLTPEGEPTFPQPRLSPPMSPRSPLDPVALGPVNMLQDGESLGLDYSVPGNCRERSLLCRQEVHLAIAPQDYNEVVLTMAKAGRYVHTVCHTKDLQPVILVCQVDAAGGMKSLTVRSPLQIKNHGSMAFKVLASGHEEHMKEIGVAEPAAEFNVPFSAYGIDLFMKPEKGEYEGALLSWAGIISKADCDATELQCPVPRQGEQPVRIMVTREKDDLSSASHRAATDCPACVLHLRSGVSLQNLLPYPLKCTLKDSTEKEELTPGQVTDLYLADPMAAVLQLSLCGYFSTDWHATLKLQPDLPEVTAVTFSAAGSDAATPFDVKIEVSRNGGQTTLAVFSPYWMVNKTGRLLQYHADDIYRKHPADYHLPFLFSYKPQSMFSKNKVQLCVTDSKNSDSFSLDTVGSGGCVKCTTKGKTDYQVGIMIRLGSCTQTKLVCFSPYFTLSNKTRLDLEVSELGVERWLLVPEGKTVPFWPEGELDRLLVKVKGSNELSKPIDFTEHDNGVLLRLGNKYGGLIVDVNVVEHAAIISFSPFFDGAASALLVNHTQLPFTFTQSGVEEDRELPPGKMVLYTWADPCGKRQLKINHRQHTFKLDLIKNEQHINDESGDSDAEKNVFCISFLDGLQRVVLLTSDDDLNALEQPVEQSLQRIVVSLQACGLSLVNNARMREASYIALTSTGIVWEEKPKRRWKTMSGKWCNRLEEEYQQLLAEPERDGKIVIDDKEVDLFSIPMKLLGSRPRPIRRNFLPAIKLEYSVSAHQTSVRAQINRIQIDSQVPGVMFPVVFHPVPPPKSLALDSEPKPFADVSIITHLDEHSKITQIPYFMVLIQEMAVMVDMGFIGELMQIFAASSDSDVDVQAVVKQFEKDLEELRVEQQATAAADTSAVSFYEHLHISTQGAKSWGELPELFLLDCTMMNLFVFTMNSRTNSSFALSSGSCDEAENDNEGPTSSKGLTGFLQGMGATLTDLQDVIFRLAFFEVKYKFYTSNQLMGEAISHYSKQALKQMYKVVLGLDVLGNPFGLIHGLSEGVEAFFYEPYQGAVQGPEEFMEGVSLGVKSLLGHAVGGAAGVVSRITGTVGKGFATMSMDEEYQQRRRDAMNQRPKDLREGLTRGGKGLLKGVLSGVTGVFTKPIEGARNDGAIGFFKGVGKGLVGVVARPAGGVVDMASSTLEGIKRATDSSEIVHKLRPPRVIQEDGIIRPYSRHEGEGSQLLQKIENGIYASDNYRAHAVVTTDGENIFMITNRRILFATKAELFGQLTCDWQYLFQDFTGIPAVEGRRLRILAKEKLRSVFHVKDFGKILNFSTEGIAQRMWEKIEESRRRWRDDNSNGESSGE